jgi:cell division protein FtsB
MLSKQAISSKFAICGLLILLVFLADLKYKQYQSQKAIQQQMQSLQQQADTLQKKNDELNESLQYLNSPGFKERVAREDLGLKKAGETVYSFGNIQAGDNSQGLQAQDKPSNFQKWWNYFFALNG